jgi:hypothetical protein
MTKSIDEIDATDAHAEERDISREWSQDLIKQIAMDIGEETVAYIEVMYPKAIEATASAFKLSVRNHIYDEIILAMKSGDEGKATARLQRRKFFRRDFLASHRRTRK